jgi:DNA-binding Lrp family transcriptional regulator
LAGSLFRDEDELLSFVTNELSNTPGVVDVETMITVGLSKVTFAVVEGQQLERQGNPKEREAIGASLDEGDYAIIRELQRDARQSAFALAAALGMNRNTVAARLRRLLDQEIVRAVVIADPVMMGYSVMAVFGLSVLPGQIEAVLAHLRRLRNLQTSVLCIGRYNIVVWCLCRNLEELYDTVTTDLANITGLRDVETMLILRTKKATLDYLQPPQSTKKSTKKVEVPA